MLYPLKMKENRVWRLYLGGVLLDELRAAENPSDTNFPEDWLASVVEANNPPREDTPEKEGLSKVEGEDGGVYLKDIIHSDPVGCLGEQHIARFGANFGVLTKFLDSAERLPIQVHPTKAAARALFNSEYGKTESWYILNSRTINGEEPYILLGFKKAVTREEWKDIFERQDIGAMIECMHKIPVKKGDVFLITGGTPHAIGPGCFLLEVQEPTDYTISVEKTDMRGKVMPDFLCHQGLGFEKMFDCFDYICRSERELLDSFKLKPVKIGEQDGGECYGMINYSDTPCFALNKIIVRDKYILGGLGRACCLAVTQGLGTFVCADRLIPVKAGDCLFVPADCADIRVVSSGDKPLELLECLPPDIK